MWNWMTGWNSKASWATVPPKTTHPALPVGTSW